MSDTQSLRQQAQLVAYERNQMLSAEMNLRHLEWERAAADELSAAWAARFPFWQTESNAALESFLIHYRNLQHFLSPGRLHKKDVTAGPFLGKPKEHRMCGVPIDTRTDIHSRLAHISTDRLNVKEQDKPWRTTAMLLKMEAAWRNFLKALQVRHPERLEWFKTPTMDATAPPPSLSQTSMAATTSMSVVVASTQSVPAITTDHWIEGPPPKGS